MALEKCAECGRHYVSSKTAVCLRCGARGTVDSPLVLATMITGPIILFVAVGVFLVGAVKRSAQVDSCQRLTAGSRDSVSVVASPGERRNAMRECLERSGWGADSAGKASQSAFPAPPPPVSQGG